MERSKAGSPPAATRPKIRRASCLAVSGVHGDPCRPIVNVRRGAFRPPAPALFLTIYVRAPPIRARTPKPFRFESQNVKSPVGLACSASMDRFVIFPRMSISSSRIPSGHHRGTTRRERMYIHGNRGLKQNKEICPALTPPDTRGRSFGRTLNQRVVGSSPTSPTNKINILAGAHAR